jgi:GT2 family glycosyltransferase
VAASAVNAPYIAFLNDDVIVTKEWLTELVKVMSANSNVGIVQPKLLKFDHRCFDSAGDFIDKFGFEMRRGGDREEVDRGQYDKDVQIFSARGAAFLIGKDLFSRLGGFDEDLSLTFTDIDLCWRARLEGYRIVYAPKSVVFHYGSASTPSSLRAYYSTKNRILILFKNYETCNALKFGLISMVLNAASVLGEIVINRNGKLAAARLLGIIGFLKALKSTLTKRKVIQSSRKVPDMEIIPLMKKKPLLFTHWLRLFLSQRNRGAR